jgi:hypothetical protein
MINTRYLHYIPFENRDDIYHSLVKDIYFFYYGVKPNANENIICINGDKYDLRKDNLILISN